MHTVAPPRLRQQVVEVYWSFEDGPRVRVDGSEKPIGLDYIEYFYGGCAIDAIMAQPKTWLNVAQFEAQVVGNA